MKHSLGQVDEFVAVEEIVLKKLPVIVPAAWQARRLAMTCYYGADAARQ